MPKLHRDVYAGVVAGELMKQGYFEEEFLYFGCLYQKDGRITTLISENEEAITDCIARCLLLQLPVSSTCSILKRAKVTDETKDALIATYQAELEEILAIAYPNNYFALLAELTAQPSTNSGAEIILQLAATKPEPQILRGIAAEAVIAKVLSPEIYRQYEHAEDPLATPVSVVLYGFQYKTTDQKIKTICNARKEAIFTKKIELTRQKLLTGPILAQPYRRTGSEVPSMAQCRADFEQWLASQMTEACWQAIHNIHQLPSVLQAPDLSEIISNNIANLPQTALEMLQYYSALWLQP